MDKKNYKCQQLSVNKENVEIAAKMTQWKIPSRHLQSWLLGSSRSATKSTRSMVYRKFWLFNIQKQHKDIVTCCAAACFCI